MDLVQYRFKTKPYEHQHIAFSISCRSKYYAYLMDLGTGKTKVTLDCAAYMFDNGWINSIMIFGNKGSYTNWVDGIKDHLPEHIEYSIGLWSSSNTNKQNIEMEKALVKQGVVLRIFLMNIEAIAFKKGFDAAINFVKSNKCLAVVDESTTIANPSAARTKAAIKIGEYAIAKRILTGSSVDNNPLNAWSQFQFLHNGALGFTSYYAFRSQYANLEDMKVRQGGNLRSFKVVTGFKNLNKLQEAISKVSYIVKKEDCLDLPKKTVMYYDVELTNEQRSMYETLKKRSMVQIKESFDTLTILSVKLAITKMLRLHQLVCGHLRDDDGTFHEIKSNRLDVLDNLIDETSGKIIIWTSFTYDVELIVKHLRNKYGEKSTVHYYGKTTNEEREYVKKVFKRGGEVEDVRFVVANDKTGGYGNNFTAITTAIYYSYDFDNNIHHQTMDRIHRIGQTEPVTYIYLKAKNTIDEKIVEVLTNKMKLADMLTKSNWKNIFE